MSTPVNNAATFSGLVDLAAADLGGRALGANDEFFAGADNLVQPGRGVFIEGKFTDRGKWMDGWESRRKRGGGHGTGMHGNAVLNEHDWCVLALGAPGEVVGLDIDTHFFAGNHPPFASVEGLWAPGATNVDELSGRSDWVELLGQGPLRPDSQNLFAAVPQGRVSHVRLNIFPDGGVARFRVFGRVHAPWTWQGTATSPAGSPVASPVLDEMAQAHVAPGLDDLAAVLNGGLALACSDAFFGPMNNLLLPGRALNMGGGWETRRRRGPGYDWILVRLGARGVPSVLEIDTNHFKGNFPERASVEIIDAPGLRITDLVARPDWRTILPESKLTASSRHFFNLAGGAASGAATHVRLNIFPDGGVSRLRIWGRRDV